MVCQLWVATLVGLREVLHHLVLLAHKTSLDIGLNLVSHPTLILVMPLCVVAQGAQPIFGVIFDDIPP